LLCGLLALIGPQAVVSGQPPATPSMPGHFTLETPDGRQVTDANYRGKWLLVYFGYTSCPDICPTVLLRIGLALDSIGPVAQRIQPIFITVDPARDTPERLTQYLAAFNPRIVALRGDLQRTQEAAKNFHAYFRKRSLGNDDYTVDHSSFLYLINPQGRFDKLLADSLSVEQIAAELRTLAGASGRTASAHIADADDTDTVQAGKVLYMRWCASCHGRRLQGQPLWQLNDEYAARRAPAHDQTGHTRTHSDEELFEMTRNGRFASSDSTAPSYMPAFRDFLTDREMTATLAFIKATWPLGLRISQAMLNPGHRGMPAHAAETDWTLPPNCVISAQAWRATSR
jgi:protein SCO1